MPPCDGACGHCFADVPRLSAAGRGPRQLGHPERLRFLPCFNLQRSGPQPNLAAGFAGKRARVPEEPGKGHSGRTWGQRFHLAREERVEQPCAHEALHQFTLPLSGHAAERAHGSPSRRHGAVSHPPHCL